MWREKAHSGPVYAARFSPDGRFVVSCDAGKKYSECIVWSASNGQIFNRFEIDAAAESFDVAISPDGKQYAFPYRDDEKCSLKVVSSDGKTLLHAIDHYEYPPEFVFFSPNSKSLYVFADSKLERWSTKTWKCAFTVKLMGGDVTCATHSSRPSLIYAGDRIKKCILVINPKNGDIESKLLQKAGDFTRGVRTIQIVSGKLLAGYSPGIIVRHSLKSSSNSIFEIDQNEFEDEPLAIAANGIVAADVSDSRLRIWKCGPENA